MSDNMPEVIKANEPYAVEMPPMPPPKKQSSPPKRTISSLARKQQEEGITAVAAPTEPPKRTPSTLQRLGIANLDLLTTNQREFQVEELPIRSPLGTTRDGFDVKKAASNLIKKHEESPPKELDWHNYSEQMFFEKVQSRTTGLTTAEVQEKLKKFGYNEIEQPPKPWLITKFCLNCLAPFSIMLEIASILCFIIVGVRSGQDNYMDVQSLALAIVLLVVVLVAAGFQTWMEFQSDNLMDALKAMTAEKAYVFRNGELVHIPANEIVPGDVVRVETGEKVPADMRIIDSSALKINNSSLTGEPLDIALGKDAKKERLWEALNIARSGCCFTQGHGVGVVFATANNTFFGQIAKAAVGAERPDTLMRREVRRLVLIMGAIGTITGFVFFAAAMGTNRGWVNAIVTLVGLFVANIPEGLLPQITLALTITANRMKEHEVIVTNLEIIETLGAVSTICSDKTGTLTLNKMTAVHVYYDNILHVTEHSANLPEDKPIPVSVNDDTFVQLLRVIALCSEAAFLKKDPAVPVIDWNTRGDASETGLIKFHQTFSDIDSARQPYPRLAVLPFSSSNKFMASVNKIESGSQMVFLKGAAERVVKRCSTYMNNKVEEPFTPQIQSDLLKQIEKLAGRGERVLGFAQLSQNQPDDFPYDFGVTPSNVPIEDMCFMGLVALADPPRPSVPKAVADCHTAGIHVIMITGDHPMTAVAIARSIGIVTKPLLSESGPKANPSDCSCCVTGEDMEKFTQQDWDQVLSCAEHVFARTQPQQKQQIVYRLQERGQVVAMTGDGVNDAPALKAANVGVCVASGTTVAKEASHLIIREDFEAIVVGVKEGRQIFDNLKKALVFVISHLMPEILPFVLNFALQIPLSMQTIAILLVDLGTDLAPSVSLAYEECEERVMKIPPRTAEEHLIKPNMLILSYVIAGAIESFFAYWAFIWTFYDYGFTLSSIRGADDGYMGKYTDLDTTRAKYYKDLCSTTTQYTDGFHGNATLACGSNAAMNDFLDHFNTVVMEGQSAYFITFASIQFAYCLCYRHQLMSLFDTTQALNHRMLYSIFGSICFMVFVVYCPGLNAAFSFAQPKTSNVCSGLWGLAVVFLSEEIRKWWCRTWPEGRFAKLIVY